MGGRLYASLNDRLVREVRMTGENTYASHDGVISLAFRPNAAGDQVTVMYDKNAAIAAQYRVAAREQGALWRTPNVGGESIHGSSDDRGGMLTASLR
jgi:hypothetical protein